MVSTNTIVWLVLAIGLPFGLWGFDRSRLTLSGKQRVAIPSSSIAASLMAIRTEFNTAANGFSLVFFEPLSMQDYLFGHFVALGIAVSVIVGLYQLDGLSRRTWAAMIGLAIFGPCLDA